MYCGPFLQLQHHNAGVNFIIVTIPFLCYFNFLITEKNL